MQYLIGLDLGTSACKAVLVSPDGELSASHTVKTEFIYPKEGFVEISPAVYYKAVCSAIRGLVKELPKGSRVHAVSCAAASGNTLLLDKKMQPLTNIISWLDTRGVGKEDEIAADIDVESVHSITGWPWSGRFPLVHLLWLKKYEEKKYRKAGHYGMALDWLYYRFTGRFVLDHSTAATFYLQNQLKQDYHEPFLTALEIQKDRLPALQPSGTAVGTFTKEAAHDTGLDESTLLVSGSFDHPSAARAAAVFENGQLLLSLGTSWVGFFPVKDRNPVIEQGLLCDPYLYPGGPFGAIFSIPAVGGNIDAYVNSLFAHQQPGSERFAAFNRAAAEAEPGAGGLRINPFVKKEGAFVNGDDSIEDTVKTLLQKHSAADISRAVMEGAAFELKKRIDSLQPLGFAPTRINLSGGPSSSTVWAQIVSEVNASKIEVLYGQDAGAAGAALLAGIGCGFYSDEWSASEIYKGRQRTIEPDEGNIKTYRSIYTDYQSRYRRH